jgi:mRNA interferase RelE/StbE
MNAAFRRPFLKDTKKIKDDDLREKVDQAIEEVRAAADIRSITNVRKLFGFANHYRIRVGTHRIGIEIVGDTVWFGRLLPRRDFYRHFP